MKEKFTRGTYVPQHKPADLTGVGSRRSRRAITYDAFVPAPLQEVEPLLSGPTAADVADAERALLAMEAAAGDVLGMEALSRSLLRSEAVASSWIEALEVSHRKLAEAEHGAPGGSYEAARRVVGNVRAMARAIEIGAQERELLVDDLLSMHGTLMSDSTVAADRDRAGQIRDEPVFIGGVSPDTAEYVGPPPNEVPRLLDDLVTFLNTRQDLPGVVVAALGHAQFESIHPFHDGNGRVGRCLVHTVLRRAKLSTAVFPPISVVLAKAGGDYVAGLNAYRRDDLDGWISFFAVTVTRAARASTGFGAELTRLSASWRERVHAQRDRQGRRAVREGATALRLIAALPGLPVFGIRDVADHLDVSWVAAQQAVGELEAAGVIKQVSAGKRNRVYEALELFDLVEHFERQPETFIGQGGMPNGTHIV